MPNYCDGYMYVRGYKDNVEEFIRILNADYSYYKKKPDGSPDYFNHEWCTDPSNFTHIPHMFRIFEAEVTQEVYNSGVYKCVQIDLSCAWSFYCCMFKGPHTYFDQFERDHYGEHFGTHILRESKRLQLEIEIWSHEPGMCFQEHYKICSGVLIKDEEYSTNVIGFSREPEFTDTRSYMEFKTEYGNKFPDVTRVKYEDLLDEEYYLEDKHPEQVDFMPGEDPIYMGNLVMCKIKER